MNFKEILELIDKVAERGIAAIDIEQAGTKIRIEGKTAGPQVLHSYGEGKGEAPAPQPAAPHLSSPVLAAPPPAKVEEDDPGIHIITSPIVGTFYRSPNPDADPFVNVGDRISRGKVLCIVEAMKLMNEIESDTEGVIERVFPQNGQAVEYGEKLFAVRI